MKPPLLSLLLILLLGPAALAQEGDPVQGELLAGRMREARLWDQAGAEGLLDVRGRRGRRSSRAILLAASAAELGWRSSFSVDLEEGASVRLVVDHGPGRPPRYLLSEGKDGEEGSLRELGAEEIMRPFAEGDFWPADLGLHHFHWPVQILIPNPRIAMRKGISCHVLESRREEGDDDGYYRVRSWISRRHGGLIYAEASDRNGRRLKTFEVSDIEKVGEEWKVRELRIRDSRRRSTTRLILPEAPPSG